MCDILRSSSAPNPRDYWGVDPVRRCACGRDGCLEAIASAAAIARRYTGLSGNHVTGAHEGAARLSTDAVARQVWQDAVEALADGLGILSLFGGEK